MSEYLSKEEIKQWRSSLEKITLEEFAARLGKKIEEKKPTNDLVDIVLHGQPVISNDKDWSSKAERLSSIANKAFEKEREIYLSPFSVKNLQTDNNKDKAPKKTAKASTNVKTDTAAKKDTKPAKKTAAKKSEKLVDQVKKAISRGIKTGDKVKDEVRFVFKKALTDREQKVFDYLNSNRDKVVYAKDLAELLELPRDYIYKYIKNLRAKIEGDALKNADKGGFVLSSK